MNAKRLTSPYADMGFTLVEVLMAMLIMTVGLLGLLQSVNVAYEHHLRNRLREEALMVGEEQMLLIRQLPTDSSGFINATTVVRVIAGTGKKFFVRRECQVMSSTKRLKVTVGWSYKNVSSSQSSYTLKTL